VAFDVGENRKITRQILLDISRAWNIRRVLNARFHFEEGMSIEDIASKFNVKAKTAENYIKKFDLLMDSDDIETQYKAFVAFETPDKHASPESLENIRAYVIKNGIHKTDWFFLI
jgi:predicted DNA-binding protein YlxM (UPF0122 family)